MPNSRKVISLSLGGTTASNIVDEAVRLASDTFGIVVVVAAGNVDMSACDLSPARSQSGLSRSAGLDCIVFGV